MDGLQAARRIRALERDTGKHPKIAAMTAYAMKIDQQRCPEAGIDGYLAKPIQPAMLSAVLEEAEARPGAPEITAELIH